MSGWFDRRDLFEPVQPTPARLGAEIVPAPDPGVDAADAVGFTVGLGISLLGLFWRSLWLQAFGTSLAAAALFSALKDARKP